LGEQRDLHVGRAGVASVEPVLLNNSGSVGLSRGHIDDLFSLSFLTSDAEEYTELTASRAFPSWSRATSARPHAPRHGLTSCFLVFPEPGQA
jgi:hypothetical protein